MAVLAAVNYILCKLLPSCHVALHTVFTVHRSVFPDIVLADISYQVITQGFG